MHIEYFFCKIHIFWKKEEWNKVAVSKLKEIPKSIFPISSFVFPFHDSFPVTLKVSNLTQNIRHTSFLLVLQMVWRETETAVARLLGRQFLLKSRQIPWLIYDGVYFKQSCTYQLINNFTKNDHHPRSASRFLPNVTTPFMKSIS